MLFLLATTRSFGKLSETKANILLKKPLTFKFCFIELWLNRQNSRPLEIQGKLSFYSNVVIINEQQVINTKNQ